MLFQKAFVQPPQPERRTIPIYLQAASAGTGQLLDDETAEEIDVDDSVLASAEFGVRLAGDSMTPRFADGQIVWPPGRTRRRAVRSSCVITTDRATAKSSASGTGSRNWYP